MCVCGRRLDGCAVVGLQQPPILASGSEAEDLKKLDDSCISYYRAHNCAASSRAEDEHASLGYDTSGPVCGERTLTTAQKLSERTNRARIISICPLHNIVGV